MNASRGMVMLLIALIAGGAAVVMASRMMQAQSGAGNRIAVAAVEVEIGGRLAPEMLKLVDWPPSSIPVGAFTDLAQLDGRVVKTGVTRGEPLIEGKLAPTGTKGGLSAVVAEGKRAMTVRVNDVIGVSGFALPGNYVDIIVNTQADGTRRGGQEHSISKIVLERILVLAVAQESDRDSTKPKVVSAVTLEVSPEQAEALDLARSIGSLSLVLRNQVDPNPGGTDGATRSTLFKEERPVPIPVVAVPRKTVVVRRAPVVAAAAPAPAPVVRSCVVVINGPVRSTECF